MGLNKMATAEAEDIATPAEETQNKSAVELTLNVLAAEVIERTSFIITVFLFNRNIVAPKRNTVN